MHVPYLDLASQHHALRKELDRAIGTVIGASEFVLGREVAAFEEEFAGFCGTRCAVAVNSGTSALHLALLACDIGPGDEVITVPMTFVATVAAIRYVGAKPVFVDVDPDTLTLDPASLEAVLSERTKAIVPVHLYGAMADMTSIMSFARSHGLRVIEDAAQAHGAGKVGHRAGSIGDIGCFSFYPGKNLGACGEAGAIVTQDQSLAEHVRMLRDWGQSERYCYELRGYNYRMDAIQGAVLRVKLRHLDNWIAARREKVSMYRERLAASPLEPRQAASERTSAHHICPVMSERRASLRERLAGRGIVTGVHYPVALHLAKAHCDLGYREHDFPNAERVAHEELSLPLYPELRDEHIEHVCDGLLESIEQHEALGA